MQEVQLIIGTPTTSSWSLRAWLALRMAGIDFVTETIVLRQLDTKTRILERNPSGTVPALATPDGLIWESLAICQWAADRSQEAGSGRRLRPLAAYPRAHMEAVSAEMHAGFAPLRKHMPMDIGGRHRLESVPADVIRDIDRITTIWRACRNRFGALGCNGDGPFLYGGFTIADAMYAPVCTRFRTYGVSLDPVCQAYVEAIECLPEMAQWSVGNV